MTRSGQLIIFAFIGAVVAVYILFSHVFGGDKEAILEGFRALSERLGKWTMPLYVAVHAILIAFCLPYAIVFEAGAAYLFGFSRGVLCVFSAKILSGSLSFWIGRVLFRSSSWARSWIQSNKLFRVISEGVAQDGWKFVLLARFSPIPSYIINYALAATDVRYAIDFLLPSMLGCVPMILQNTSIGRLTSVATHREKTGIMAYLFPLIALTSSGLITWRIKKYTSNISVLTSPEIASSDTIKNSDKPTRNLDNGIASPINHNLRQRNATSSST